MTQTDIPITLCGDGSYCCEFGNTACCNNFQGFWISKGVVYPYISSPFTAASISQSTTSTAPATPTPTATNDSNSDNSRKLALGIGLGIGIPILILLSAVVIILLQRNRNTMPAATDINTYNTKTTNVMEQPYTPQPTLITEDRPELEGQMHY
jgi:Mid2 like cell wall stress sensor